MKRKVYIQILLGVIIGIGISLITYFLFSETSDKIRILGFLVNAAVLIYISTQLASNQANSKSLKEYYTTEIKEKRLAYLDFIASISKGDLTKQEITSKFSSFSQDFLQLKTFISQKLNFESHIQEKNRQIHISLCDNNEFDILKQDEKYEPNRAKISELESELKEFKYILFNLISNIHTS